MTETVFVHLTDPHIQATDDLAYGADPSAGFRDAVAWLRQNGLKPAFALITGDLANHGERGAYERLRGLLEEAFGESKTPVLLNLGNHDSRSAFREVFFRQPATDEAAPYHHAWWHGDLRVIMLDSLVPGAVHGLLGESQLAWLRSELATRAPGGTVIGVHHPPVWRGLTRRGEINSILHDRAELKDAVRGAGVLGILSGHTHVATTALFGDSVSITGAATAFLGDAFSRDGGAHIQGCGFNLCVVREGELIVNPITLPGTQAVLHRYTLPETVLAAA
jgi:3',5'-cyclic AMP phosphodiesterase CpdA